jgi:hypothetical protein
MTSLREDVQDLVACTEDDQLLFADGLDEALLGVVERFGMEPIALYDRDKVIDIFMADADPKRPNAGEAECDDAFLQAEEHYGYNVIGAWVGDKTPAYAKLVKRPLEIDPKESEKAMSAFLMSDSSYKGSTSAFCNGRDAWRAAIEWMKTQA